MVVIGAGQGGLAAGYALQQAGIEYLILDRGKIGESWRSQRWDNFSINTPNWSNGLEGLDVDPDAPDAFPGRDELVAYLVRYADCFGLKIREHSPVRKIHRTESKQFEIEVSDLNLSARAVIVATGGLSLPKLPQMALNFPSEIISISAGGYRNPQALPEGAVLVVGSGQSGSQIAEDLIDAGREVYLCTGRVGRVPRVYRGRDFMAWWDAMGLWEKRVDELEDPNLPFVTHPQVSGNDGGHTLSLQLLANKGVVLLGRALDYDGKIMKISSDLLENIKYADDKSAMYKRDIDKLIADQNLIAPPPEIDPGEPPMPDLGGFDELRELDLVERGISSIIWCTGFYGDWGFLDPDFLDIKGNPQHQDGIGQTPGIYYIGMPWLHMRKSGILYGVSQDARRLVRHLQENVLRN